MTATGPQITESEVVPTRTPILDAPSDVAELCREFVRAGEEAERLFSSCRENDSNLDNLREQSRMSRAVGHDAPFYCFHAFWPDYVAASRKVMEVHRRLFASFEPYRDAVLRVDGKLFRAHKWMVSHWEGWRWIGWEEEKA